MRTSGIKKEKFREGETGKGKPLDGFGQGEGGAEDVHVRGETVKDDVQGGHDYRDVSIEGVAVPDLLLALTR